MANSTETHSGAVPAVIRLALAQVLVLSVWFSSAAILPALAAAHGLEARALAGLSTATQIGFVFGALAMAIGGVPDRFDPRRVFALSATLAAVANLGLLWLAPDGTAAIGSRLLAGAALAGVYPVGLKIAMGWSLARRGLIASLLVGALTLGSASPHLAALLGGADWRLTLQITSTAALLGGMLMLPGQLGPYHARAQAFNPKAISQLWTNRGVRLACLGYFGHMWELYAFWAWVAAIAATAATRAGHEQALSFGSGVAFLSIALGAAACVPAGWYADRAGKAPVARLAMIGSAVSGLLAATSFAFAPLWLLTLCLIVWGICIIPDSALFSALVADHAPPELSGSLMTLQTAIGFAITILTVQSLPLLADHAGWPIAMALLAIGPLLGQWAMARLSPGSI